MAAFSSCFCHSLTLHKINNLSGFVTDSSFNQRSAMSLKRVNRNLFHQRVAVKSKLTCEWSFMRGSRIITRPYLKKLIHLHTSTGSSAVPVRASLLVSSQIVSKVITIGTAAVLPFYILMVLLPKSVLTKRTMGSSIPSVMLGVLYAYLLYLSWTPNSMSLIFATKHWLPELPGLAKMFSSEMTLASAWIHLLAVDLFAARFFMTDWKTMLRPGIQFVSACLLVLLGSLCMPSPRH